ncbi:MAG: ABC-type transport auxiliary lipoprotein family protein [Thiomonas sp.]|jgi:cholesterol transport system auxiliary component
MTIAVHTPARRALLALLLTGSSALLGACALPVNRQPVQQTYRLTAADITSAPLREPVVVQLLPVRAAAGLQSAAMLYSRSPDQLAPYRDSRWLAPPAQLIGDAIAQTLARQPWVSAVQQQTALANARWALHCSLDRLEHDLRGSQGTVHLALVCELANQRTRQIAAHWRFDRVQPIAVNDAAHFARGAQMLLDRALDQIVRHTRDAVLAAEAESPARDF